MSQIWEGFCQKIERKGENNNKNQLENIIYLFAFLKGQTAYERNDERRKGTSFHMFPRLLFLHALLIRSECLIGKHISN